MRKWTNLISTGDLATGDRFHDIGHDGDGNEEPSNVIEDEGGGGRVRVFKGAPHTFPQRLQDDVTLECKIVLFQGKKG